MEEDCNDFAIFKRMAYDDQILRISLLDSKQNYNYPDEQYNMTKVFPIHDEPQSFMILCKKNQKNKETIK